MNKIKKKVYHLVLINSFYQLKSLRKEEEEDALMMHIIILNINSSDHT